MLDSARELFSTDGYEATTTKAISDRAGVAEGLIFTNFGSKSEVFQLAVVAPFSDFIAAYLAGWEQHAPGATPEKLVSGFVEGLFELTRKHRSLLLSCVARTGERAGVERAILARVAESVQSMAPVTVVEGEVMGLRDVDPPALAAVAAAMVFGTVMLDEMLFPPGVRRPGAQRLIDEMIKTMLHGFLNRPASPA